MKRWLPILLALLVCFCFSLHSPLPTPHSLQADETIFVPMTIVPETEPEADSGEPKAEESPQAAIRRMSRTERRELRRLSIDVRNAAAKAMEMRPVKFMRQLRDEKKAVDAGRRIDTPCMDEVNLSLREHDAAEKLGFFDHDTGEIDIDRFMEILRQIFEMLLQLFSMFAVDLPVEVPPIVYAMVA